ncbi:hypothetical protein [Streptomyces roseoverticillatus]|uniref:hypothetical protein n=1 Tax=Streptomyces roseoverticillatus TaxID=66429 RepID=UPI001F3A9282|nr:hypothetical protein [Streptomyces roseoverticillatus]
MNGGIGNNFGPGRADHLHGSPPRQGSGVFFSTMRSWAAAVALLFVSGYVLNAVALDDLATASRLASFGWRVALIHVPNTLYVTLAVWAAARLHPEPHRDSLPLHLLAALGVPFFTCTRTVVEGWDVLAPEGIGMTAAALVLGGAGGLLLARLRRAQPGPGAYSWGDSGVTATEYIGTVVVVVAVMASLISTAMGKSIADTIKGKLCQAFGGACGDGTEARAGDGNKLDNADFEPTMCNTANTSSTAGQEVKIAWFKLGNEYGFQQQKFKVREVDKNGKPVLGKDGKPVYKDRVRLTFSEAGKAGVAFSPKWGEKLGKLDENGKSEVELSAGVKVTAGDTWQFDSQEEADKFRDKLERLQSAKAGMQYARDSPMVTARSADHYMKLQKEVNNTINAGHLSYGSVGLEGAGDLKLSGSIDDQIEGKLGGKVKVAPTATITKDGINHTTSKTFAFKVEGSTGGEASAAGTKVSAENGAGVTGAITVTRDENNHLKRIIMTRTQENSGKAGGKHESASDEKVPDQNDKGKDNKNAGKSKGKGSVSGSAKDTVTEVVTTTLDINNDTQRDTAEKWLKGNGKYGTPLEMLLFDGAPTEKPGDDDKFGQLMFDDGKSSKLTYDGVTDAAEFGAELNLGMVSFGYTANLEASKDQVRQKDAEFLGAPQDGKRSYLPMTLCSK